MSYDDLKYLSVPLPEDVEKLKGYGDFERMRRVMDLKLSNPNVPMPLKKRLEMEKEIIRLMPEEYPYDTSAALTLLRDCFGEFTEEELSDLRDQDAVEWAYIDGEVHYKDNFLSNLIKTRQQYKDRVLDEKRTRYMSSNRQMLVDTIHQMKKNGGMSMRFHMRAQMTVTPQPENLGKNITAYLPLPIEYAQVKNFRLLSKTEGTIIAPADYPQRTAVFIAKAEKENRFEVEYEYETHMTYVEPDPQKVTESQPTFYTEEYAPHIRFTPYLKMLAKEIVGDEHNPLLKARKIYDFITTRIMYSYMRAYITMPMVPEYAASSMKGDCGVQALLFITLCRIVGVPARWQAGLYVQPNDVGSHDWAQFYVAPYGWLFADCSFGGSAYRAGDTERWNFYFGNLDPYRLPANSEYQHDFYIPTRYLRADPYDNQQGEAEYDDGRVPRSERETNQEIMDYKVL